jgi:putative oxidoreductase
VTARGFLGYDCEFNLAQRGEVMSDQNAQSTSGSLSYLYCADGIAAQWQDFLLLVGRVLLGWVFVTYGWSHLMDMAGFAKTFPGRGLPEWLAYVASPVEFIGGVLLIVGLATRYTIVVLLVFMLVATFSSHAYWSVPAAQKGNQTAHFWKNISMIGGLLAVFVTGAGRWALDWILAKRK